MLEVSNSFPIKGLVVFGLNTYPFIAVRDIAV